MLFYIIFNPIMGNASVCDISYKLNVEELKNDILTVSVEIDEVNDRVDISSFVIEYDTTFMTLDLDSVFCDSDFINTINVENPNKNGKIYFAHIIDSKINKIIVARFRFKVNESAKISLKADNIVNTNEDILVANGDMINVEIP